MSGASMVKDLPRLFMVTRSRGFSSPRTQLLNLVRTVVTQSDVIIQLREKHLAPPAALELALELSETVRQNGSILTINERFDIALAAGAGGVHLPENACPADAVRASCPGLLIGQSVHSSDAAMRAEREGADYLLFGPVFETPLKKRYGPPQGLDRLEEVCRLTGLPVFAIGGITPASLRACLDRGAYGIAAMSLFCDALEPEKIVEQLVTALEHS